MRLFSKLPRIALAASALLGSASLRAAGAGPIWQEAQLVAVPSAEARKRFDRAEPALRRFGGRRASELP